MRITDLYSRTLRDAPSDAELPNHKLLIRAGFVRPVAAGIYALLPLGVRVMRKLEAILRDEMDALGGQEVRLPVVQPAEVWQKTGRWDTFGPVLQRFEGPGGRGFALAPRARKSWGGCRREHWAVTSICRSSSTRSRPSIAPRHARAGA